MRSVRHSSNQQFPVPTASGVDGGRVFRLAWASAIVRAAGLGTIGLSAAGLVCVLTSTAAAQPGLPSFTGGLIRPNGFPDPLIADGPGTITASGGTGGGSTGGGIGGGLRGLASATVNLTSSSAQSQIALTGSAFHPPVGVLTGGYTGAASAQELVLTLDGPAQFSVSGSSSIGGEPIQPVVFRGISGVITGDPLVGGSLSAGTYGIRFAICAGYRSGMNQVIGSNPNYDPFASLPSNGQYTSATLNWTLTLVPAPSVGAALVCAGVAGVGRRRRPG